MRALAGGILAALLASTDAALAESAGSSLNLTLLAQEFRSVCIATDAEMNSITTVAQRRGWRERPPELSRFEGARADRAWDADLSSIAVMGQGNSPRIGFVVTVANDVGRRECAFIFEDTQFNALTAAIATQGLEILEESNDSSIGGDEERATFCLPASDSREGLHEIIAERRRLAGWSAVKGMRVTIRRLTELPSTGGGAAYFADGKCPISLGIVDFQFWNPEPPNIEPWLGQKPEEPPSHEELTE